MNTPQVGQAVAVCHVSDGNGRLQRTRSVMKHYIEQVYEDNAVRLDNGEVWVVKAASKGCPWETSDYQERV